jgi:ABC-type transport system involved in multi-copper enzyme maturation permease subunit
MIRVIRAEWRKLRRPTLFLGTIGVTGFLIYLFTYFLFKSTEPGQRSRDPENAISPEMFQTTSGSVYTLASTTFFIGTIAYSVFAAQTSQEYTYGTIRNLLLRQPGRLRLLLGKLIAMKIFALIMVGIGALIAIGLSVVYAPQFDIDTTLWFGNEGRKEIVNTLFNVSISVFGFGILGMIMGILLRSAITTLALGLIWLMVVEGILLQLARPSLLAWTPGSQLQVIGSGGTFEYSYSHGLTISAIYVFGGGLVAAILFSRRDVAN